MEDIEKRLEILERKVADIEKSIENLPITDKALDKIAQQLHEIAEAIDYI